MQGTVYSWSPVKRFGTIHSISEDSAIERFFFYGNRIISGPEPTVGAFVIFEVGSKPPAPGKLPFAESVQVLATETDKATANVEATPNVEVRS